MTIPWQMNCPHDDAGWCLDCVFKMGEENERLRAALCKYTRWEQAAMLQRNEWAARYEFAQKFLADILFFLPSPPMKLDDGRTMQFVDPGPRDDAAAPAGRAREGEG
jgi:hypothetical protein